MEQRRHLDTRFAPATKRSACDGEGRCFWAIDREGGFLWRIFVQKRRPFLIQEEDLVTTADLVGMPDAVKLTGVSGQTLRRWVKKGRIQGENIAGRLWTFDRAELERIAAERQERVPA